MINRLLPIRIFSMLAALLLVGCGWHLRGQIHVDASLLPILIQPDDPYSPLQKSLRQQMQLSQLTIVANKEAAQTILTITQEQFSEKALLVGASGDTRENALTYQLGFQVTTSSGQPILQKTITVKSNTPYQQNALLSSSNQADHRREALRERALSQLLRQLSHLKRPKEPSTTHEAIQ